MVRKIRNFKVKYFITTEFLQGTSLEVPWLGLGTFTAVGLGSVFGGGTEIPQVVQHGKKNPKKTKKPSKQKMK